MISCEQHDYVEIACMYRYLIKLTLKSGLAIEGIAMDTKRNNNQEECIQIKTHNTNSLVVLDTVSKMDALIENPHFKSVIFQ